MSVQALTWAFKQEITPAGLKFILVALANYASDDGYCYPSQKKLGELTGQSERAVRGHLATLERRGFIAREERRKEDGTRNSDGFYLVWSKRQILPVVEQAADSAEPSGRFCMEQAADSAGNTKGEYTKEDTKEGLPPVSLRSTSPTGERERIMRQTMTWDEVRAAHGKRRTR